MARGTILLVATEEPMSTIISRLGDKYPIHYVNTKWIGGMLTNWKTLSQAIRKLHTLDFLSKEGRLETLSAQDIVKLKKQKLRLEKYLGGIKYLTGLPWLVIVLGPGDKRGVISECEKLDIPTIGVLDTYCNPNDFTIYVPCSAEAPQSHSWIVIQIIEAIVSNLKRLPKTDLEIKPSVVSRPQRSVPPKKYLKNPLVIQGLIDDFNNSRRPKF
jgi:small subunit ribosomal protein S2